jgi:long-chain acyl-CoA synthetase
MMPDPHASDRMSALPIQTLGRERLYAHRPQNLITLLTRTVEAHGDTECLADSSARLTYHQLYEAAGDLAAALHQEHGIGKGDRVALMLHNSPEYVISLFAIAGLGAISVPLNTALKGQELCYPINDSGATLLIADQDAFKIIADIRTELRTVKAIIVIGESSIDGTVSFAGMLGNGRGFPTGITIDENDGAVLLYTSGTTGAPKGALLSNKNIIASAMNDAQLSGLRPRVDSMLLVAPLFHITGLAMCLCSAVYAGIRIVLIRKFKAAEALHLIEKERVSVVIAVPTVLWLMFQAAEFDLTDVKSLRFLASGGAAVPEDLLKICMRKLPGVELAPGYGLTEATGMTHSVRSLEEALSKPGSVGQPMPLMDARIVDASGNDPEPGTAGELLVRGCQVMLEYWNNPQATRDTIVEGWLHTGDIAAINAMGDLQILDRMKDMIIRGGENIYSTQIENVLYMHPKVLEAAVVGIPDTVFGEQVKAALVLKSGEQATAAEIQDFCKLHMADYKVPYRVEFMPSLPRNPAGKVIKTLLK